MIGADLTPSMRWALGGIFVLLVIASLVTEILRRMKPQADWLELRRRVNSWWVMAGVFSLAMAASPRVSIAFFAFVSFLALKEYLSLIPTRRADRRVLFWTYLAIPIQYLWVVWEWYGMFIVFIPVYMFMGIPIRMILVGETAGFLKAVGMIQWGLMITVFALSHVSYLLVLPAAKNPVAGGAGLVLYLVFLTQFNDVAQYIWGKSLGRHKVVPTVSPNKTWEGLIGGVLTTAVLAVLLAPVLTPLTRLQALIAGPLIGLGGFFGDVNVSSLKRDLGVKDSGTMIAGHGGILDRVNSLTFTAMIFFHYVYYLHY
jgi:phosphatidate cytidylyltransferase